MSLAFGICVCQPFISTKPCWTSLMAHPVSPSKSFVEFCYHVVDADPLAVIDAACEERSEEHTSELQSLMRISYAVFCLKNKTTTQTYTQPTTSSNQISHIFDN